MSQPNLDELIAMGELPGCKSGWESSDFLSVLDGQYRDAAAHFCNAAPSLAVELKAAREKIAALLEMIEQGKLIPLGPKSDSELAALLATWKGKETT